MKYYINRTNPTLSGIDSIFNDLFGDNFYSSRIPQVDVYETNTSYVLEADIAGYDEKEIKIGVEKHVLTLSSEEKNLNNADERKYLMREISRPAFSRSFTLPEDVDEENISAETKSGILTLTLPKKAPESKGRIEVKIN